jgi:hypothetical protein
MSCTPSTTRITRITSTRREGEGGTGLAHLGSVALSFLFYLFLLVGDWLSTSFSIPQVRALDLLLNGQHAKLCLSTLQQRSHSGTLPGRNVPTMKISPSQACVLPLCVLVLSAASLNIAETNRQIKVRHNDNLSLVTIIKSACRPYIHFRGH